MGETVRFLLPESGTKRKKKKKSLKKKIGSEKEKEKGSSKPPTDSYPQNHTAKEFLFAKKRKQRELVEEERDKTRRVTGPATRHP